MKLLIINSEFPPIGGGAGGASAFLSASLARLGQEVTLVTSRFGSLPGREQRQGVTILRIPALRRRADRSGWLEQGIFALSSAWHVLGLSRRWRPDAVIAFFGVPSGPAAWLLKKVRGVPYVVSLRGGDVPGFRPYDFAVYHRLIGPFLKVILREARAVVANSQGLLSLAQAFAPRQAIAVIPNGVDAAVFTPVERAWAPPEILFVGRLVYQKGLDLLLAARAGLQDFPWRLTLVGDGPLRPALEDQALQLGIRDRLCFAGWQPRESLPAFYHRANLFALPSRHEGMPNVLLEAMACGLPVVASRIAGSEELVLDGRTGRLFPSEDARALGEVLRDLFSDPGRAQALGVAARTRVQQEYSWGRVAEAYLALITPGEGSA